MSIEGIELLAKTQEVTSYLYRLSHMLDDFQIEAFVDEFTEDGSYRLIPRDNLDRDLPVHIINDDKPRLRYRRDLILRHWQYEPFRATRMLSNILIDFVARELAESVANFVVYQTDAEGASSLHMVGKFRDRIVLDGTRWRIKDRLAILENFMPDKVIVVPP